MSSGYGPSGATTANATANVPTRRLPRNFLNCPREDLIVLIARMLISLININDNYLPIGNLSSANLTRFHSRAPPAISIYDYLLRLAHYNSLENSILIIAIYYIDLLSNSYKNFNLNSLTVHRFLLTATTIAAKGLCDYFCTNHHYAKVGGINVNELNFLEMEFLEKVNWRIIPRDDEVNEKFYSGKLLTSRKKKHRKIHEKHHSSNHNSNESGVIDDTDRSIPHAATSTNANTIASETVESISSKQPSLLLVVAVRSQNINTTSHKKATRSISSLSSSSSSSLSGYSSSSPYIVNNDISPNSDTNFNEASTDLQATDNNNNNSNNFATPRQRRLLRIFKKSVIGMGYATDILDNYYKKMIELVGGEQINLNSVAAVNNGNRQALLYVLEEQIMSAPMSKPVPGNSEMHGGDKKINIKQNGHNNNTNATNNVPAAARSQEITTGSMNQLALTHQDHLNSQNNVKSPNKMMLKMTITSNSPSMISNPKTFTRSPLHHQDINLQHQNELQNQKNIGMQQPAHSQQFQSHPSSSTCQHHNSNDRAQRHDFPPSIASSAANSAKTNTYIQVDDTPGTSSQTYASSLSTKDTVPAKPSTIISSNSMNTAITNSPCVMASRITSKSQLRFANSPLKRSSSVTIDSSDEEELARTHIGVSGASYQASQALQTSQTSHVSQVSIGGSNGGEAGTLKENPKIKKPAAAGSSMNE